MHRRSPRATHPRGDVDLAGSAGVRVLHLDAGIRLERLASLGQLRALSRSTFSERVPTFLEIQHVHIQRNIQKLAGAIGAGGDADMRPA